MITSTLAYDPPETNWLSVLRRYIVYSAVGHLLWESAHIPLYTIWVDSNWSEIAFAVVHCTGGDLLIAMSTLLLSLFLLGGQAWPTERAGAVLLMAVVLGVAYTIFSEWLNIVVRAAWAYREIMPLIPVLDAGLTPLLQWMVVPAMAYWAAIRFPMRQIFGKGARD